MKTEIGIIVEIFKALACETRLKIVIGLINTDECNVNLLAGKLGLAQPNVSQHLLILKNAGIIEGYRSGTHICYRVVNEKVRDIIKVLNF